jgi:N-acetylglucosaminyl-diphospho-decaprenol L-rhamnosyltransferase
LNLAATEEMQTTGVEPTHGEAIEAFPSDPGRVDPGSRSGRVAVDVSVIVVNYNTAHLLAEMRAALLAAQGGLALQTIVIDNASRDDSLDVLRHEYGEAELIVNRVNVGFGRANNQGVERASGRYVLLLNTDAFVAPDTLDKTVRYMDAHPDCGVLGVRLEGRDGELQPSCRYFPTPWNVFLARTGLARHFPNARLVDDMSWDHAGVRECDWVTGCYYLVRREVIDRIGLFDPRYFLYCEEMDHCRRTKQAGWKVVYFGDTRVVHLGGESAKSDGQLTVSGKQISALQVESELLYFRKHHGLRGVWATVLLSSATDLALIVRRRLARGRPRPAGQGRHLRTLWSLFAATRLGTRPTR